MPETLKYSISQSVAKVRGITEAHLPQCLIEGDAQARQVIVITVHNQRDIPRVAEELVRELEPLFARGQFIDIIPYVGAPPDAVRESRCEILARRSPGKKPWWRFW